MRITRQIRAGFIAACILFLFSAGTAAAITAAVEPDTISINSFYHGSTIDVSGEAAADEDIVVKISSDKKTIHMRQKGKKSGLWMNTGELEYSPVTDVYLVFATGEIESILSGEQQDEYMIGYGAFRRIVEVSPVVDKAEKEKWVDEFVRFKEKNNTYGIFTGSIETNTENGGKTFRLNVDWPYQAPPQKYTLTVYAVKDGEVRAHKEIPLKVEQVGALKYISGQAFNNAAVYGVVSILIAIASGFIVSVIFKGGGGSH